MSGLFVAIIGTQSSGSSAIAGVAYHVGVWMGHHLGGRYGRDPDNRCGFEDHTIGRLMRRHVPFLQSTYRRRRKLINSLDDRIKQLQREASRRGQSVAGAKYPRLSRLGPVFVKLLGDNLRVIDCDRPLADSIKSLQRKQPRKGNAAAIQNWLWQSKQAFLAMVPASHQLSVPYYGLLENTEGWAVTIADFLGLTPTQDQLRKAVQIVHPDMLHIGG